MTTSDAADRAGPPPAPEPPPQRGPLDAEHVASGARMAVFAGWSMPLEHPGGGVVREHAAVREAVGVFDVSHLGALSVRGPGAAALVDACLTAPLARSAPGRAQYTLCCEDEGPSAGGVVDDLIAYWRSDEELLLVPNAANAAAVAARLRAAAGPGLEVADEHRSHAVLAVQGPRSGAVLDAVGLPSDLEHLAFVDTDWRGLPVTVCRTGYTGERGVELLPRWADAPALWAALLEAAAPLGGVPCGLGARDTLRTEVGYALHGHELGPGTSPLEARLGWAVGWGKPAFWGREALLAERERGPARLAWGLVAEGRGVPRAGMAVRRPGPAGEPAAAGPVLGTTTSGTHSPTRRQAIALALLETGSVAEGDRVVLDVRGRELPATVVRPPFVPDRSRG